MARKVRLATRIGAEADELLRLFVLVERMRLGDALSYAIKKALPPGDELRARQRQREQEATA
jgi:hypothetical protein